MNDGPSGKGSLISRIVERITLALTGEPHNKQHLAHLIKRAHKQRIIDFHVFTMIEGAMEIADLQVKDLMVPRAQVVSIKASDDPEDFLPVVIDSGHSRFPVFGEDQDDVLGILLAKDLLPLAMNQRERFNLRDLLRSPLVVPESKRIDAILREFRDTRSHMAIVINEYGSTAGIITIEDVLEQIVGKIEDETDIDEDDFPVNKQTDGSYIVKALMPVEYFNEHFGTDFDDDQSDTIGGVVLHAFGRVPHREEQVRINAMTFEIISADSRAIKLLRVIPDHPARNLG